MMRRTPTSGLIAKLRDNWDVDRLFEAEKAIVELEATRGWEVIIEILTSAHNQMLERMLGPVMSQADYAYRAGMLSGIDQPFEIVEAVKQASRQQREKLEQQYAGS